MTATYQGAPATPLPIQTEKVETPQVIKSAGALWASIPGLIGFSIENDDLGKCLCVYFVKGKAPIQRPLYIKGYRVIIIYVPEGWGKQSLYEPNSSGGPNAEP